MGNTTTEQRIGNAEQYVAYDIKMLYAFRKMKYLERKVWLRRIFGRLSYRVFFALDRVGLHLLAEHYYTPVADYSWLRKNPEAWMGRTNLACVHWALDEQLDWLRKICEPHHHEVVGLVP